VNQKFRYGQGQGDGSVQLALTDSAAARQAHQRHWRSAERRRLLRRTSLDLERGGNTNMASIYNTALLAIFGGPAFHFGLKYTLKGAYRGLVEKRVPMGEDASEAATGWSAIAIGVYCLLGFIGIVFTIGYLGWWLLV
jgi:hypothetical protein